MIYFVLSRLLCAYTVCMVDDKLIENVEINRDYSITRRFIITLDLLNSIHLRTRDMSHCSVNLQDLVIPLQHRPIESWTSDTRRSAIDTENKMGPFWSLDGGPVYFCRSALSPFRYDL